MLKRLTAVIISCMLLLLPMAACSLKPDSVKIGVSFGVGAAVRWEQEKVYMEEHAQKLGVEIEIRLNKSEEEKPQREDCFELIDSGIDVLIITARDVNNVGDILDYAKKNNVPVIAYARVIPKETFDLFVGYDSARIGQQMGRYLSETVYEGDYILLQGSETDNNATLLYEGALRYIDPIRDNINVIFEGIVPNWSPEEAEKIVSEAVAKNGNKVDAILAPNDAIAGACAKALADLGITQHVVITGMDAELEAAKRIIAGTQDTTIYMDLRQLANTAIEEAVNMATGQKVNVNSKFDNQSGGDGIDANLITGQLVIMDNLDSILIDSGYFTHEEVYGR